VPAGGPVPAGFAATSVTFVSLRQAFVLGTAPCAHAPCASILRTLDRGVSWRGLPAPVVPLGQPGGSSGPAVWGIRFGTPSHGFVFGNGLWETTDGGEHWAAAASPGGSILSLEVIDGQVLALVADCRSQAGCGGLGTLTRRPLSGGAWHEVMRVREPRPIATQARVAAVLDGSQVVVTSDGGITVATRATPCTTQGVAYASSVAVTSPYGLALLCIGQGYTGHTDKIVYISGDLGAHWARAGTPPSNGDPFGIDAGTPTSMVVAAASGGSWLFYSADGAHWRDAYFAGDGGLGWNDLGFTSTTNGVAVHGPVLSDSNSEGRPGQLLLTSDGGVSWKQVRF
jgi:photosystem II stability/assembly factor-like uncharacterized protein